MGPAARRIVRASGASGTAADGACATAPAGHTKPFKAMNHRSKGARIFVVVRRGPPPDRCVKTCASLPAPAQGDPMRRLVLIFLILLAMLPGSPRILAQSQAAGGTI